MKRKGQFLSRDQQQMPLLKSHLSVWMIYTFHIFPVSYHCSSLLRQTLYLDMIGFNICFLTFQIFPGGFHQLHLDIEPVKSETLDDITQWLVQRVKQVSFIKRLLGRLYQWHFKTSKLTVIEWWTWWILDKKVIEDLLWCKLWNLTFFSEKYRFPVWIEPTYPLNRVVQLYMRRMSYQFDHSNTKLNTTRKPYIVHSYLKAYILFLVSWSSYRQSWLIHITRWNTS